MTIMNKILMSGAGFAALAAAAPATAQYIFPNTRASVTNMAAQRCSAAVQNRLSQRSGLNIFGIVLGANTYSNARVLAVTQVVPRAQTVRVRGVASSGRMAYYDPYGASAYGMLGSNYAPAADLTFRCSVDYRGYVRDIDINRR